MYFLNTSFCTSIDLRCDAPFIFLFLWHQSDACAKLKVAGTKYEVHFTGKKYFQLTFL